MTTQGAFHLDKISGISGSAVNGTRFISSSHWKIPKKSGKAKKVGPFSRLEFPNGMSCAIYVSRSLYQFQVHGRAPRRTGVYDQMEQLFTNLKFHFCSHWNFRFFFLNGKRPQWPWMRILTSKLKSGSLDGLDVSMDNNNNNNLPIYIARIYMCWSIALYNHMFKRKRKYITVRIK